MKYIKTYEAWKPLIEIKAKDGSALRYKEEWKVAGHPERKEISQYLMDIFQELKDEGYSVRDGGYLAFSDYPYVWISSRTRRRRGNMNWDMVNDCILSAQSYLESKGFITLVNKLNDQQVYLYFDKDPNKLFESFDFLQSDVDDMILEFEDNGYLVEKVTGAIYKGPQTHTAHARQIRWDISTDKTSPIYLTTKAIPFSLSNKEKMNIDISTSEDFTNNLVRIWKYLSESDYEFNFYAPLNTEFDRQTKRWGVGYLVKLNYEDGKFVASKDTPRNYLSAIGRDIIWPCRFVVISLIEPI